MNILYKNYNEDSYIGYFLEVDVKYSEKLYEIHSDFSFYQKK